MDLAASGNYPSVAAVERKLRREGFENVDQHLHGRSTRAALLKAIKAASPPTSGSQDIDRPDHA